jgi:uncharacterized protein DUF4265
MKILERETQADTALVKIVVPFEADAWHSFSAETLWAADLGEGTYELRNTPFFATGLAFRDVVRARPADGRLVLVQTVRRSGHSTYRALFGREKAPESIAPTLKGLADLGCTYESFESAKWILYAIDVPPPAARMAYGILASAEEHGILDFEEGHFGGGVS